LFTFSCCGQQTGQATIKVHAVDWSLSGDVVFSCNDDELACALLTRCRCDAAGYFNLLAGCKPVQVEQWLEYLKEQGTIRDLQVTIHHPGDAEYADKSGLKGEELEALLSLFYRIGGFNRLQITRYMKQRGNASLLSTRYGKEELERFRLLNEVLRLLHRLK
jgi:hypothetical protein